MKTKLLLFATLMMSGICFPLTLTAQDEAATAQVYHMPTGTTFTCEAASRDPVTSFYQFQCRGINLENLLGDVVGSFSWLLNGEVQVHLPNIVGEDIYDSHVTAYPPEPLKSPFQFSWKVEDGKGVYHTGTATVTWKNVRICSAGTCWWHPRLLSFSTTAN
jgi:hypothetical protein